jgi:hypothetical protein
VIGTQVLVNTAAIAMIAAGGNQPRPVLPGELTTITDDGRFVIHHVAGDEPVVEQIERGFAGAWAAFVDEDGWAPPPADDGRGGDDRIDVYVHTISANGYAHTDPAAGGTSCWMEIDPDVINIAGETAASVAAHELHHCLQFVQTTALAGWIYEATSTYAQYLLHATEEDQALELAREVLWRLRLVDAADPLDREGGQFEYAGMVFAKFWVDRAGDRAALLDLWQAMATAGTWELASTPDDAADFGVWQWFACERDDGRWAPDGTECELDARVRTSTGLAGTSVPVGRYGTAYAQIAPDCTSGDLQITVTPSAPMRVRIIESRPWADSVITEATSLTIADWNHSQDVVIAATALDGSTGTFAWTATPSGTYAPPSELPPVSAVTLDPPGPFELAVGDRVPFSATAVYGTCEDGTPLTPTIADPSVARFEDGAIVAVAAGATYLSIETDGVTATAEITVVGEEGGCGCRSSRGAPSSVLVLLAIAALTATRRAGTRRRG